MPEDGDYGVEIGFDLHADPLLVSTVASFLVSLERFVERAVYDILNKNAIGLRRENLGLDLKYQEVYELSVIRLTTGSVKGLLLAILKRDWYKKYDGKWLEGFSEDIFKRTLSSVLAGTMVLAISTHLSRTQSKELNPCQDRERQDRSIAESFPGAMRGGEDFVRISAGSGVTLVITVGGRTIVITSKEQPEGTEPLNPPYRR
jgi:hypothetical protein